MVSTLTKWVSSMTKYRGEDDGTGPTTLTTPTPIPIPIPLLPQASRTNRLAQACVFSSLSNPVIFMPEFDSQAEGGREESGRCHLLLQVMRSRVIPF